MKKCENCYHKDICPHVRGFDLAKKHFSKGFLVSCQELMEKCENFKDKSLIVELPCEIWDIVYEISNGEIYSLIILNAVITDNNIEFYCREIVKENIDSYGDGDVDFGDARSFTIFDINKTIFISREDAEKGLKNA